MSLANDVEHTHGCHDRWCRRLNRDMGSPDYRDEWRRQQCLHCDFYIGLMGRLKEDWGVCSHPESKFDGRVMFEHDGCEHFRVSSEYSDAE